MMLSLIVVTFCNRLNQFSSEAAQEMWRIQIVHSTLATESNGIFSHGTTNSAKIIPGSFFLNFIGNLTTHKNMGKSLEITQNFFCVHSSTFPIGFFLITCTWWYSLSFCWWHNCKCGILFIHFVCNSIGCTTKHMPISSSRSRCDTNLMLSQFAVFCWSIFTCLWPIVFIWSLWHRPFRCQCCTCSRMNTHFWVNLLHAMYHLLKMLLLRDKYSWKPK